MCSKYFGLNAKVRSAIILLMRRMITLLRTTQEIIPYLRTLVPSIFNLTFISFVECQNQVINQDELRESLEQASTGEKEYDEAIKALNFALQQMSQLGTRHQNSDYQGLDISPLRSIPPSFSGYQEVSQLCVLLNFIILTFRGTQGNDFLLSSIPGFEKNASSQQQPVFFRLFNQLTSYWRLMPSGSPEFLREKNEIHRDIFTTLYALAQNTPSTLLTLLEEDLKNGISVPSSTSLLSWLSTGAHPKHVHSLPAATMCIQTWTSFLTYVVDSPRMKELTNNEADAESFLFDQLGLASLMRHATQVAFLLDMENPQHNKVCCL